MRERGEKREKMRAARRKSMEKYDDREREMAGCWLALSKLRTVKRESNTVR